MFIVSPDPFLTPCFRISPFKTEHIAYNWGLSESDFAVGYLDQKFGAGQWKYTYNGREAIKFALDNYELKNDDLVTIITTSNNFYISSCVTKEIEKVCLWNREIVPETKLIFVNHEFGYPYPDMEKIKSFGLPIIEDCCTTFFSQDRNDKVGSYGEFSFYSLTKFFPIQIGGILVSNVHNYIFKKSILKTTEVNYIQSVLSHNLIDVKNILDKRKENFHFAISLFSQLGFSLRFDKNQKIVPSVLLLKNNGRIKNLVLAKDFLMKRGIQCSLFYGEDAFFLPNHQNLSHIEIIFMFECIRDFINKRQ